MTKALECIRCGIETEKPAEGWITLSETTGVCSPQCAIIGTKVERRGDRKKPRTIAAFADLPVVELRCTSCGATERSLTDGSSAFDSSLRKHATGKGWRLQPLDVSLVEITCLPYFLVCPACLGKTSAEINLTHLAAMRAAYALMDDAFRLKQHIEAARLAETLAIQKYAEQERRFNAEREGA